jgi:hypothetical protein
MGLLRSTQVKYLSFNLICFSCTEDAFYIEKGTHPEHKNKTQTAATGITWHTKQQASRPFNEEKLPHPHQ